LGIGVAVDDPEFLDAAADAFERNKTVVVLIDGDKEQFASNRLERNLAFGNLSIVIGVELLNQPLGHLVRAGIKLRNLLALMSDWGMGTATS
jgi:hypothetical protein